MFERTPTTTPTPGRREMTAHPPTQQVSAHQPTQPVRHKRHRSD